MWLRYGSTTRFDKIKSRWRDIVKETGIGWTTCQQMVVQFHQRGNSPTPNRHRWGRKRREIPDDVEHFLRTSLHELRFLSLQARCDILKERFGYPMSKKHLAHTYRRMGVGYARTKTVMKASTRQLASRKADRLEFAKKLASLLA